MQKIYTQDHLVEIIVSLLKKYHAERAILFGSYARKEAESLSDIDLLVIGGPSFDSTDIFALAEDLHQATGKNVDVYELCEVKKSLYAISHEFVKVPFLFFL